MAKSSKDYWAEREQENLRKNLKTEVEYYKEIENIYKYTMDQIQKEIDSFYAKYASKEGISIAEAKKRASRLDMEEFSRKAKKYVEEKNFSKQANDEMRLYNLTMKVNRLELLKAQIGLELVAGFDELQRFYEEKLTDRTMEEFQRQAGILGMTVADNAALAAAIVNASFKNATFSERIWMHQDLLRAELDKLLQTGLIQGRNPRELARMLRGTFDASIFNSERLLRTELARVQTEAQRRSYIENGFDQYTYITTGDGKVCSECKPRNGKHYNVEDMAPGDNAPPMHPLCRCSTAAYMDDKSYNEWLSGYKDHGLSYADWKAKTINNRLFNYDSDDVYGDITEESIIEELRTSAVGRDTIKYMEESGVRPRLEYEKQLHFNKGDQSGRTINIYISNLKNPRQAAQAVIHEITHQRYDIGGCQWAEVVCYAKEKMHIENREYLTISEKRYIIKLVKDAYSNLNWKKGGYKNGKWF